MKSTRAHLLFALTLAFVGTAFCRRASAQTWTPITQSNPGTQSNQLSTDTDMVARGYYLGRVTFKGGTNVAFVMLNGREEVVSGVLARDTALFYQGAEVVKAVTIGFKAGGAVSFNTRGQVISGVLARDTPLFKQGVTTGSVIYKAGATVTFNEQGRVVR